jgi:exonuclease III
MHNNVYSLLPKLDLIEHEFLDYDVICISESHLDKSIDNDKIKLKGFQNPVRLDRNRHGGGVNIYVKKILYYKVRTDLSVNNLEILWVELRISNNEFFLAGVIYRSPNSIYIYIYMGLIL